ncbi:MAG: hypothetical protein HYR63_02285 [Proteobacteria bacterium]|nr:hypothetical protein [Pseudomonadota bacterium]MBI3498381.1 hypothetical protein [Pseudomonadota bacterium]
MSIEVANGCMSGILVDLQAANKTMAAGVTKTLWSIEAIVRVVDEWEVAQKAA